MKNKNLPLSPHLQIYKPQLTSILSIAHRITGFCLSLSIPIYLIWLICLFFGDVSYSRFVIICSNLWVKIIFIFIIYGFSYHMLNGFRHVLWDFGYGLSIKFSTISAILIIIFSSIITILISIKLIF